MDNIKNKKTYIESSPILIWEGTHEYAIYESGTKCKNPSCGSGDSPCPTCKRVHCEGTAKIMTGRRLLFDHGPYTTG